MELAKQLLEQVATGGMDPGRALSEWPDFPERDRLLDAAWHHLSHFATDADIREKDGRYAEYQKQLLRKRIEDISRTFGLK